MLNQRDGSTIQAGGIAAFVARGNGTSGGGNPNMYAGYYPNGVGMNVPSSQDIANSVASDAASRELVGKQTWAATALAGGFLSTAAAGSQLAVAARAPPTSALTHLPLIRRRRRVIHCRSVH